MLNNTKNNTIAMQELQSLLAKHETAVGLDFNHLKYHIQCYAHIINICSSHIISSMTSVSEWYLSDLKVPADTDHMFCAEDDDDLDDGDINSDADEDIAKLRLDGCYNAHGDADLEKWFAGIKCNPLRCAHRVICLLCSSDLHKQKFCEFIQSGNKQKWFTKLDDNGKHVMVQICELQLLRDVKTRWDSVYMMLKHLRYLQPVSLSQQLYSASGD